MRNEEKAELGETERKGEAMNQSVTSIFHPGFFTYNIEHDVIMSLAAVRVL